MGVHSCWIEKKEVLRGVIGFQSTSILLRFSFNPHFRQFCTNLDVLHSKLSAVKISKL